MIGCVGEPVALLGGTLEYLNQNVFVFGDGYTEDELGCFHHDAARLVDYLISQPWYSNEFKLRILRQDIASHESGKEPGGINPAQTYFETHFEDAGLDRVLLVGNDGAVSVAEGYVTDHAAGIVPDLTVILVNTYEYGGSHELTRCCVAVSDAQYRDVFLHELAHGANVTDEYGYYSYCFESDHTTWYGNDSPYDNVTSVLAPLKWSSLKNPANIQIPTSHNWFPVMCDMRDFPQYSDDTVGAFDGAGWYHHGLYRPSPRCKMRKLQHPFCTVCRKALVATFT